MEDYLFISTIQVRIKVSNDNIDHATAAASEKAWEIVRMIEQQDGIDHVVVTSIH